MHLTMHLTGEVAFEGLVFYQWMYPIERSIQTLKFYVRNMNHLEESIAEDYLDQEYRFLYYVLKQARDTS